MSGSNLLPDSARRIADAGRDAESGLRAALAAIPESENVEDYVPPFCAFASSMFDAEAAENLTAFDNREAYESFLKQDLAIRIIERILPDQSLESANVNWSPEVAQLSIENEIGSEIILECRPDGKTAPARDEIQAVHAQHGDWERFAPLSVRFRVRLIKKENALVRENLRQALKRRSWYWLGRFSLSRPVFGYDPSSRAEPNQETAPSVNQTNMAVPEWACDLDTPGGRRMARDGWKRHWTTAERVCTNDDLSETALNQRDRPFLNQWENGNTRLKDSKRSSRIQAIERVLRSNTPPKWHTAAKENCA